MNDSITLSPRQYDIAELVAEDLSNKEIADRLGIAPMTVKNIMTEILRRTGARTRVGVARAIMREHVIVRDMSGQGQRR